MSNLVYDYNGSKVQSNRLRVLSNVFINTKLETDRYVLLDRINNTNLDIKNDVLTLDIPFPKDYKGVNNQPVFAGFIEQEINISINRRIIFVPCNGNANVNAEIDSNDPININMKLMFSGDLRLWNFLRLYGSYPDDYSYEWGDTNTCIETSVLMIHKFIKPENVTFFWIQSFDRCAIQPIDLNLKGIIPSEFNFTFFPLAAYDFEGNILTENNRCKEWFCEIDGTKINRDIAIERASLFNTYYANSEEFL